MRITPRLAGTLRAGLVGILLATVAHATDVEGLFLEQHDFSGTYKISTALSPDSTASYGGTLTILKPTTVRTPRGTSVNVYRLRYALTGDSSPIEGIAVEASGTLFTAYGNYAKYGLMLLSRFELPNDAYRGIEERDRLIAKNQGYMSGVTFKGKYEPWWWEFKTNTNGYGFWFHMDGSNGYVAASGVTFPFDEQRWEAVVREVMADGNIKSRKNGYKNAYREGFYMSAPRNGHNLRLMCGNVEGVGMRVTPDLIFGTWGGNEGCGAGMYEVKGRQLVGTYASMGGDKRGVEILEAPDDVVAKNPLFK